MGDDLIVRLVEEEPGVLVVETLVGDAAEAKELLKGAKRVRVPEEEAGTCPLEPDAPPGATLCDVLALVAEHKEGRMADLDFAQKLLQIVAKRQREGGDESGQGNLPSEPEMA